MNGRRLTDYTEESFQSFSDEVHERALQLLPGLDQTTNYLIGQWNYYLRIARGDRNPLLIETLGLVCADYNDPQYFVLPVDYIQNFPYFRPANGIRLDLRHIAAFWQLYKAMNSAESGNRPKTNEHDKAALLALIFEDPSRAPMMSAIVTERGVLLPETMLGLLDCIAPGVTALSEGVL